MENKHLNNNNIKESVYKMADASANNFNLMALVVICALTVVAWVLNELGIFAAYINLMRIVSLASILIFSVPLWIWLFNDKILKKKQKIVYWNKMKTIILICAFLGITLICITLSFHAVLLMVIPSIMAAQYRYNKKTTAWIIIASAILVFLAVYGSYFFGLQDRNFIKGALTDEEAKIIANRFKIATPKRMGELIYHYAMPRLLGVISIEVLVMGISKRNERMANKQIELSDRIKKDMEKQNEMQTHVIESLSTIIETRDVGTGEHVKRTKLYFKMIASELMKYDKYKEELTPESINEMVEAAPLHDVGKICVSDVILLKPGKLTSEEFDKMKIHTTKGGEMVNEIFKDFEDEEIIKNAYDIAMFHHEKWNGCGYPQGLKGEEIPLSARIMAIADVFDALVSKRVYKDSIAPIEAFSVIESESGTHFDPDIIEKVQNIKEDLIKAAMESVN